MRLGLRLLSQSRGLASVAQVLHVDTSGAARSHLQVQRLSDGLILAALPTNDNLVRFATVVRAGSRFEDNKLLGATHILRRVAGLSTDKFTSVAVARNFDQMGANFEVSSNRETITYSLDVPRKWYKDGAEFFADVVTRTLHYPWDISAVKGWMNQDIQLLHRLEDTSFLMEKLHKAAFRGGLNNSIYMSPYKLKYGGIGQEELDDFVDNHFTSERSALVAVGLNLEELKQVSGSFNFREGGTSISEERQSAHLSNEIRVDNCKEVTQVAWVVPGVSCTSADALPAALLASYLGAAPSVQWGGTPSSVVNTAAQAASQHPVHARTLNLNYSDTGLFGLFLAGHYSDVGGALSAARRAALRVIKEGISEEGLSRAKRQVSAELCMANESSRDYIEDAAYQLLLTGEAGSPQSIAEDVLAVTTDQVNQVAQQLVTGKQAMAAIGNLSTVPHLDELNA